MCWCAVKQLLTHSLTPSNYTHFSAIQLQFCSTFIGQVSLPCIRQLLTQVAYTLPFSFNENSFPVRIVRYSRNFFQAHLTLGVTAESQPPSASNISPKITEFIYLSQRYPITNIQMQISIKPICDWPIYLTASADERLACIKQTSFHSTTSLMDPLLATVAQNRIIANSGCLQIQQNKFPDFQEILYKIPVDFF